MFKLTVVNNYAKPENAEPLISGINKRSCLRKLEKYIEELESIQLDLIVEQGYKSTRRLIYENKEFNIEINENGAGEIESFNERDKAIKRFLEIVEEKGDHWDLEQESLFVEGVKEEEIVHQRSPDSHEATQEAAEKVIKALDDAGYNRKQVHAIAKWVQYLSTQA